MSNRKLKKFIFYEDCWDASGKGLDVDSLAGLYFVLLDHQKKERLVGAALRRGEVGEG